MRLSRTISSCVQHTLRKSQMKNKTSRHNVFVQISFNLSMRRIAWEIRMNARYNGCCDCISP